MIPYTWIQEARARIAAHIRRTPLTYDPDLDLYLKWENHQITGSFKARGALNRVLSLMDWEVQRGIVAASAGNHGQGVALAGKLVGARVLVFAAEDAVPAKLDAMRALGAELHLFAGGYSAAEKAGLEFAAANQATWISPYNDGLVIAGQGTLVAEVLDEKPELAHATWLVPASGGGLISGVATALKERGGTEGVQVIGVQTEASPFMYEMYFGRTQEGIAELPSLADGLAGPVEEGSITIPLIRKYVDDFILISEEEIVQAIRYAWEKHAERIEASAAVPLAAVLSQKAKARPAVAVISGGNIQPEVHAQIVGNRIWKA